MYGVIGINFVDHFLNQGALAEHKSAETPIGHESGERKVSFWKNGDRIKEKIGGKKRGEVFEKE